MAYQQSKNNTKTNITNHNTNSEKSGISGTYIGQVVGNTDKTYMGRIAVHIPALGDRNSEFICVPCSPFGGTINQNPSNTPESKGDFCNAPKSYGLWTQPPAPGTHVLVSFIPTLKQGFIVGSINENDLNHMMGGKASHNVKDQKEGTIAVASEATKGATEKVTDVESTKFLKKQGLENDMTRGHSSSSARRETPSKVFGVTTPDGHVLTMDDGDASNEHRNIRLRSRGGAQILIDDTNKFIFINNHNGDSWIEMDANGNIDIYSKGSVSVHTEEDYNIHANGNVNIQADEGVNIKSGGLEGIKIESSIGNIDIYSGDDINTEAWSSYNVTADHYKETAVRIDMNGPVADKATKAQIRQLVGNTNILTSIANRVPEHHPWQGPIAKATTINLSVEGTK
jgi:hypothetical protein